MNTIEQAREVSDVLKLKSSILEKQAADTIDALIAELEQHETRREIHNRYADKLTAERDALRAALETAQEAVVNNCARVLERDAEIERLRVQLAGCGVAAMGNTEASRLQRAEPEDYGYSESYADVCRAVDREIALRKGCALLNEVCEQMIIGAASMLDIVQDAERLAVENAALHKNRHAREDVISELRCELERERDAQRKVLEQAKNALTEGYEGYNYR